MRRHVNVPCRSGRHEGEDILKSLSALRWLGPRCGPFPPSGAERPACGMLAAGPGGHPPAAAPAARRHPPGCHAGLAQLGERLICNQQVGGSSPSSGTSFLKNNKRLFRRVGMQGLALQVMSTRCPQFARAWCGSVSSPPHAEERRVVRSWCGSIRAQETGCGVGASWPFSAAGDGRRRRDVSTHAAVNTPMGPVERGLLLTQSVLWGGSFLFAGSAGAGACRVGR